MADLLASLLEGLRGALRRERLPEPLPTGAVARAHPGVLGQLFAREQLGIDPQPPATVRPGVLSTIFRPEQLGTDPTPAPRRRTNWIAFLTKPEQLDD
jgi:hypothetical protein